MHMTSMNKESSAAIAAQIITLFLILALIAALSPSGMALAEADEPEGIEFDFTTDEWDGPMVILEDPEYFLFDEPVENIPVITSVGKTNQQIGGVKSKYKLVNYTIPEQLLRNDRNFLELMVEAEKYIGYPYVYGASNPDTGFDCSGFVCWVFMHSGVYDTGRRGANGLYSICEDIDRADARPGDLVFFEKTMGPDVTGITHVGIYVGNNMMIHAGDPVGFADLKSEKWAKRIYGFGRLPIN